MWKRKSSAASSSSSTQPSPPFILVVEDTEVDYKVCQKAITTVFKGAKVQRAKYAHDAWKLLENWAKEKNLLPGMILSDCDMKGQQMQGPDLLKYVKNDNRFKHIPVVMMSAVIEYDKDFEDELVRDGADAALPKPIKMEQMREWEKYFL